MDTLQITRSTLRKELLKHYFLNPGKSYYLRELEKVLGFPVANIRRELVKLEKTGLFIKQRLGNLTFYSLNKKSPVYKEVRNIIFKTSGLVDIMKKELEKLDGIEFAFIYGSFAKGNEIMSSDIDLMLIGSLKYEKIFAIIRKIENRLGRTVNYLTYTLREIKEKLKKKNGFILDIMRNKKIMLIGKENELQKIGR